MILRPHIYKIMSQFISSLLFEYFTIRVMANKFKVCKITQKKKSHNQATKEKKLHNIIHHSIRKIQIRSLELSPYILIDCHLLENVSPNVKTRWSP
jgi:hypothetical protein